MSAGLDLLQKRDPHNALLRGVSRAPRNRVPYAPEAGGKRSQLLLLILRKNLPPDSPQPTMRKRFNNDSLHLRNASFAAPPERPECSQIMEEREL